MNFRRPSWTLSLFYAAQNVFLSVSAFHTDPPGKPGPTPASFQQQKPQQPDPRLNPIMSSQAQQGFSGSQSFQGMPPFMGMFGGFGSNPNSIRASMGSSGMNSPFSQRGGSSSATPNRLVAGPGPQLSIASAVSPARSLFEANAAAMMNARLAEASNIAQLQGMQQQQLMLQNTAKQLDQMLQARNFGFPGAAQSFGMSPSRMSMGSDFGGAPSEMGSFGRQSGSSRPDMSSFPFSASQFRPAIIATGSPFGAEGFGSDQRRQGTGNEIPFMSAPESRILFPPMGFPMAGPPTEMDLKPQLSFTTYLKPAKAVAVISGPYGVGGILNLTQNSLDQPVDINGRIGGIRPGEHGFHIHALGDLSTGCDSAGSHFNPEGSLHGSPEDHHSQPHAGDLGNIRANEYGEALVSVSSPLISLYPSAPGFVIGRTFVVHEKPDDLGRGNDQQSKETGNSGARIGCGIIGFATPT